MIINNFEDNKDAYLNDTIEGGIVLLSLTKYISNITILRLTFKCV
jgi:hypothetical protein